MINPRHIAAIRRSLTCPLSKHEREVISWIARNGAYRLDDKDWYLALGLDGKLRWYGASKITKSHEFHGKEISTKAIASVYRKIQNQTKNQVTKGKV